MSGSRILVFAVGIAIVIIYAVGSSLWVTTAGPWYAALSKPSWQPPDLVFGLIWPYNFTLLGIATFVVARQLERAQAVGWLLWLAASVVAALVWAQQFYGPHHLLVAAVALVIAALLTIPVVIIAWRASSIVGALLLPYQIWVLLAASLSIAYARLNP